MRLLRAELTDFRNITHAELEPSAHFTALIGPNGQGKTNTLEAIYFAAALKPLRSVQRHALLREGTSRARVMLRVERQTTGLVHDLEAVLEPRSRALLKDGKRTTTASFLGIAVCVAFTPDDLQLPKGSPEARRRFLDRALLNLRPAYLDKALRYAKALKDRNRLLVEDAPDAVLSAYDELVAREGAAILVARAEYVAELAPRVMAQFERIASPAPPLALSYVSTVELDGRREEELRQHFLERLEHRRRVDRKRRSTSLGPHLDDLELTLSGEPVRERASQGQHRAIVLALKLAEITHLAERLGEPPILLLDDMSSELDPERSRQLFEAVGKLEGQVILTSTEEPRGLYPTLPPEQPLVIYDVAGGTLARR
ncbi:DNA replication and repair protein RecF [Myxococcota bacterium]|nr:DNA replication and repair protein RecF [Myxococcota bacterium]